jgi:hypothetical protein
MSRPTPPAYKTRNWPAYNEALKRRGSLTIWFDPEMTWEAAPTGKRGRQPDYSDAAIQTCLTMKVLFGMALRQTTGFVESLLRLIGLDWAVPDFSTLSRRQKTLKVNIPYRGSHGPLHLLVDSTGIKVEGEGEWNARKHGGSKRRVWRKIHIGIDEKHWKSGRPSSPPATSATRPCCPNCSTRSRPIRRSPASPPMAPSTPANAMTPSPPAAPPRSSRPARTPSPGSQTPPVRSHETKPCAHHGASDGPSGDDGAGITAEAAQRPRCTASSSWANASSARDFDRQVAEFQVRVAVLNGFTALGIPVTEAVG